MFSQDEDDNQRAALGVVFAVVLLVIASVMGFGAYKTLAKPAAPAGVVAVASEVVVADGASIRVEAGVVTFYFATGKADLATGAKEALADIMAAVASGKRAAISGFHDATGDAALNAELAKQRALTVRDAMFALGATEAVVELRKPEQTQASGTNAEARRVEVIILP
ncbi:OmpA family protein [Variovorax sp. HJSM1_2]|uniref:OmpA family protein n=1 Tax=Variovorax sp. HJSM1_2 TaxID=3366263 RepID=UPI003BE15571